MTHHRLSTCHRHPTTNPITGFCASCLRERLSTIDSSSSSAAATPRLRRTKSTSNNLNAASSSASAAVVEPRRKSCDVVVNVNNYNNNNNNNKSLSSLFSLDDHLKAEKKSGSTNLGLEVKVEEQQQAEDDEDEDGEYKTMKEFIDLELENKKTTGASFWETASFFSKKLLKWKQKQQQQHYKSYKKENPNSTEDHKKPNSRPVTETLSEIGVYGYLGRRSCDTDPRLSVDNGRYSFEEPRASWDGYLIGKAYPKLVPPMAVVEEKVNSGNEDDKSESVSQGESPGGSAQTRDYYGESLSHATQRRRRSFDLNSGKKTTGLVDVDEVKSISHTKVSPETVGLFHGAKLLVTEKELRDSNWYSIKDYREESVESASKKNGGRESDQKGFKFKKWRNVLSMWGFMQKREESKCCEDKGESCVAGNVNVNVVDGPLSESWQKLKRVANGDANGTVSEKLIRSYSVSAKNNNACKVDGLCSGMNGGAVEGKDSGVGGRRRDEMMLQRTRTAAYSPNNLDNGMLRFYLTPVRSYRRSKSGRSRLKSS